MPPKHGSAPYSDARNSKRKMKEVMVDPTPAAVTPPTTIPMNLFPVHIAAPNQPLPSQFTSQPSEPDNLDRFLTRPFTSYTALLTEAEEDYGPASLRRVQDQIEQTTKAYADQVRKMLFDVWMRHYKNIMNSTYEEASTKLKEKEEELRQAKMRIAELDAVVGQLTYQGQFLQNRVRTLENQNAGMRAAFQNATLRGAFNVGAGARLGGPEAPLQEDAESSFVDPHRAEPGKIGPCKACDKEDAKMMIWPCRHVCLCAKCAATASACPICSVPKFNSFEVIIP
uniref:Probable BOI-related E3 ubiquitin-protein ligase 2 n=4 Tax=Nicotiana TaxID=4085 RepID=A0A1S4CJJ7_TOBAC|nr:PREDICTED: probable BOI-related E3 ubiquitin-protein ligase 2 [Nicotiana sylvestris]XP_016501181.1 PREDICTED: probable BOI-related E3 ubiquitin-protein ligase 2 [Nicotiana tabacum]